MKFVHFGFRPKLPSILKNGLRMSRDGAAGSGVYATPMMYLDACYWHENEKTGQGVESSSSFPMSNMRMWEGILSAHPGLGEKGASRVRDTFLVVFELPDWAWPITLQVWCPGEAVVKAYTADDGHGYRILEMGYTARLEVDNSNTLGRLLHGYKQHEEWVDGDFDTFVEVCIPHPIPPKFFKKVIPLYRTNKKFKADSYRPRKEDFEVDE